MRTFYKETFKLVQIRWGWITLKWLIFIGLSASQLGSNLNASNSELPDSIIYHYYVGGWNAFDENKLPEAAMYLKRGKQRAMEMEPPNYDWWAEFNHVLGETYIFLGMFREALVLYFENLDLCNLIDDQERILEIKSICYSTIAVTLSRMGLYEAALPYYHKSDYIDRKFFQDEVFYHFSNYRNLGIIHLHMNKPEDAEYYLTKAKPFLDHPDFKVVGSDVGIFHNFAKLYLLNENSEKAAEYLRRSKAIQDAEPDIFPELRFQWHLQSIELSIFNRDTTLAIQSIENATREMEEMDFRSPYILSRIYNKGAEFLLDLNEIEKAEKLLKKCFDLLLPDPDIPAEQINETGSVLHARTMVKRAKIQRALQQSPEDRTAELSEIVDFTEESLSLLRYFISGVLIPQSKNRLVREHMPVFEYGLLALYHLFRETGEQKYAMEALFLADQSRSVLLLEDMLLRITADESLVDLMKKDRKLKDEYENLFLKSLNPAEEKESETDRLDLRNSMAEIQLQREELFLELLRSQPQFRRDLIEARDPGINTVKTILNSDLCILTHFPGERFLFTIGISKNGLVFDKKEIPVEFSSNALSLRSEIEYFPKTIGKVTLYREHLTRLDSIATHWYNLLVLPVEDILTGHLLVIPVDEISAIPFAALKSNYSDNGKKSYLIESQNISYAYSLKILELVLNNKHEPGGAGLVVAPVYKNESLHTFGLEEPISLSPLHFNQKEARFLEKKLNAVSFVGEKATAKRFLEEAKNADWIHISAHSFINDQLPDYSFLAFSADSNEESQILPIIELEKLNLNASLVFLNGCWTGFGPIQKGEGALSLQRAFAAAGVSSLITTLWPVNDESAWLFTEGVYNNIESVPYLPSTVRSAGLDLLNSGDPILSHPYHWAGYKTYGNWNNPLYQRNPAKRFIWMVGLALLIFVFWIGVKKSP